jgi:hypothetical protein
VVVGDPERCKAASDLLLSEHRIYIQPIDYPTVPKGTKGLRITPTPCHDDVMIDQLAEALSTFGTGSSCRSRTEQSQENDGCPRADGDCKAGGSIQSSLRLSRAAGSCEPEIVSRIHPR